MVYKKILALIVAILSFCKVGALEILPEVRVAYFYPTDQRFREIYSGAGLYSVETSVQAWKGLYPWGSLGFLYASGSSKGEGDNTELYMIPIGLGLKYFFNFDRLHPYLGLGMVVAYTHIHNDSPFVTRNQSKWGVGGIVKTGFLADITQSLFFDFFLDYTYLKKSFDHPNSKPVVTHRADLSGLSIGAGLGYRF